VGSGEQVCQETLILFKVTFVLAENALRVRLCQNSGMGGWGAGGFGKQLEHQIPLLGPVSKSAQGVKAKSMGSVIGKIKAAFPLETPRGLPKQERQNTLLDWSEKASASRLGAVAS